MPIVLAHFFNAQFVEEVVAVVAEQSSTNQAYTAFLLEDGRKIGRWADTHACHIFPADAPAFARGADISKVSFSYL